MKKQNQRNRGLDWERELSEQSDKDWTLGAKSRECFAHIPLNERDDFLPKGEVQRGKEDWMCCSTMAAINILATKFNCLIRNHMLPDEYVEWLYNNGYIEFYD